MKIITGLIFVCSQSMVSEEFPVVMDRITGVNYEIHQQTYPEEVKISKRSYMDIQASSNSCKQQCDKQDLQNECQSRST